MDFWLSYVYCNTKKIRTYQEELTILKVLKKYPNKNLSRDERTLVYKSLDTKIENLIIKKLSDKQINDAKKYIKVLKMNL